jgi:valyl-tRNA synthetase
VNPLELVEKYGADAIRMGLVMGSTPGQDKSVGEQTIRGMRNFSNKIWNATRFISEMQERNEHGTQDQEFEKKLQGVVKEVTTHLEKLRVGQASEAAYNHFWHWFCDEAIEAHKRGEIATPLIISGLKTFLILLHPFAPFVTEASYQQVFSEGKDDLLILQTWPKAQ